MAIRRSKIASIADTADAAKIQPSDLSLETIPASPADGDLRTERTCTTPNRFIRIYIYDSGAWQLMTERQI